MTRLLATLVAIAWAVWFGGMLMLFVAVGTIFTTPGFERQVQGAFAARLFPAFERVQLVCAAVALLATTAWWFAARARVKLVLFTLLGLATLAAVAETTMITPRVQQLTADGGRGSPAFDRMHRMSTRVYMTGAVILLVAGMVLPVAIASDARRESAGEPSAPRPPLAA